MNQAVYDLAIGCLRVENTSGPIQAVEMIVPIRNNNVWYQTYLEVRCSSCARRATCRDGRELGTRMPGSGAKPG